MQGGEPLISRAYTVSPRGLHHVQEVENSLCRQVRKDKPCDWPAAAARDINKEEF
jgi:hypothetical protein